MKYATEMGSGPMIYTPSSWHSEVDKGVGGIHRQNGDPISLFLFYFQNTKSTLKPVTCTEETYRSTLSFA
jgi:radical SAM superfamily enzyme